MKKIFLLIIITSLFFACIKEDPLTLTSYKIMNISGQKITIVPEFIIAGSGFIIDSIILQNNENYEIQLFETGANSFLPIPFADVRMLKIYFNDTTVIVNYRDSLSFFPSGNIQKLTNWSGGKIDEYHYEYEFNFTDADYLEALKHQ